MEPTTKPVFTRYLYEYNHVKYSLLGAILARSREEALFWVYELYHSGFKEEAWYWTREIYVNYYEEFHDKFKSRLDKFYTEWQKSDDACLLGTVVGTLAVMNRQEVADADAKRFIILYKEDRHQTRAVEAGFARHYLKQVSQYPVRSLATDEKVREAYLGINWLYYCAATPIWKSRIEEGGGAVVDGRVEFTDDDLLEAFYERWGFEPDEQCKKMHEYHGVYL